MVTAWLLLALSSGLLLDGHTLFGAVAACIGAVEVGRWLTS